VVRVLSLPARRNKARNPYNFLLSEALSNQGCLVADLDRRGVYLEGWDVFHIHWPQNVAAGKLVRATRKSLGLLIQLSTQRLRGTRIVWTVHNVRGHSQSNRWLERVLMWFVTKLVHGVIFLTCSSRTAAIAEFPALVSKPYAIIPHGLYQETSGNTREQARALYGLPAEGPVVGFFGGIQPYKGLERLLVALQGTPPAAINLFIVGAFECDDNYRSRIRSHIAALRAGGHIVVFVEDRLGAEDFVDAIRACDLAAMPYRHAWNSGLAILALENNCRILTSDAPAFRELQEELGIHYVIVTEGDLTGEALLEAAMRKPTQSPERWVAFSAARSWTKIASDTIEFYRVLGAGVS
jgi:beta-1,4-mannosyltransferase